MSMTMMVVFCGRQSPLYGQGYGSASKVVKGPSSLRHRQLARHIARRVLGARGGDHDGEGQYVGRGVEEIVALRNADRLQRRTDRARRAEQKRSGDAAQRVPTRENDERHGHEALPRRQALVPGTGIGKRKKSAADAGEK